MIEQDYHLLGSKPWRIKSSDEHVGARTTSLGYARRAETISHPFNPARFTTIDYQLEPAVGFEPTTCWLQIRCAVLAYNRDFQRYWGCKRPLKIQPANSHHSAS